MKNLIISLLLVTVINLDAQLYVSASIDPNIAVGNSVLNEAGLNYKAALGFHYKRFDFYKEFESYKAIGFQRWTANVEYTIFATRLTSTVKVGYGHIYRDFNSYKSYAIGGKITYAFGDVKPFIECNVDRRSEWPEEAQDHLMSIYIGVSYVIDMKLKK